MKSSENLTIKKNLISLGYKLTIDKQVQAFGLFECNFRGVT